MHERRAGGVRQVPEAHLLLPQELAGRRIDEVHVGCDVAEREHRTPVRQHAVARAGAQRYVVRIDPLEAGPCRHRCRPRTAAPRRRPAGTACRRRRPAARASCVARGKASAQASSSPSTSAAAEPGLRCGQPAVVVEREAEAGDDRLRLRDAGQTLLACSACARSSSRRRSPGRRCSRRALPARPRSSGRPAASSCRASARSGSTRSASRAASRTAPTWFPAHDRGRPRSAAHRATCRDDPRRHQRQSRPAAARRTAAACSSGLSRRKSQDLVGGDQVDRAVRRLADVADALLAVEQQALLGNDRSPSSTRRISPWQGTAADMQPTNRLPFHCGNSSPV